MYINKMVLRVDLIFTNWIFLWFALYLVGLTQYSPKFAVIISIIENIGALLLLKTANTRTLAAMFFIIIIKFMAFFVVRNSRITIQDVLAFVVLFILYAVWVHINNETVIGYYKKIQQSLNNNDNNTPIVHFINKFIIN